MHKTEEPTPVKYLQQSFFAKIVNNFAVFWGSTQEIDIHVKVIL